jgi:hypothetical protein
LQTKNEKNSKKQKEPWNGGEWSEIFKMMMMLCLNEETKTNNSKDPKIEKSFRTTMNETKVFKTTIM